MAFCGASGAAGAQTGRGDFASNVGGSGYFNFAQCLFN